MSLATTFRGKAVAAALTGFLAITPAFQTAQADEAMYQQYMASQARATEASQFSKGAYGVGMVISTTPEQERAFSAGAYAARVRSYLATKGVDKVKIITEPDGMSFEEGSRVYTYINDTLYRKMALSSLDKDFLDEVANAQKAAASTGRNL